MTLLGSRETHTSLLCDISLHFLTYALPKYKMSAWCHLPAVIYLFKVNNWNNSTMREISSNLMIKTQESQYFQENYTFVETKVFKLKYRTIYYDHLKSAFSTSLLIDIINLLIQALFANLIGCLTCEQSALVD